MIILTIVNFFTSLFNIGAGSIGDWISEIWHKLLLLFDGLAYSLLSYSFKLFQLMCTLNFNSLQGLVSGLLTRIEALVMVFVVYKLGIALINFMLNPDEASKKGKEILINIFVTAALLLSYNTIFTFLNEVSMLIIGTPENYNFVVLGQIADITGSKDIGLVNRLVFGTNEEMPDVGEFIAFSTASVFITDAEDPLNTAPLRGELATEDGKHLDFFKLPNIASEINKKFEYFPVVGFLGAAFMIYALVKATIQVGVRAFKLLILQILAPVAIITIIGDGIKGKVFKNFISKYISVYIEVFTRMFCILLISNFVVKFVRNFGDYFPQISTDEWWTYALMILLILVAAFKFAGDIPKFIDEILGTHMSTGSDKNFIGGLLGAGVGLAAGLSTGTLAGTVSGLVGGASSGAKGKSVAEFFKGQATNTTNARNVGANARMAGGSLRYAGSRVSGFLGIPQRQLEEGKLAGERQTALDNMIKTVEDNYDGKINIGGQDVGISRDIFKNYAYDEKDTNGYDFYNELDGETKKYVKATNTAYDKFKNAQETYENKRALGTATSADFDSVEKARTAYQSLKSKTDKMIDTDYNSKMLRDIKNDPDKVKKTSRNAVQQAIETYDHVASNGHSTNDFINKKSNTNKASKHYTTQQDKTTHSRSATNWNNSNSRGGSGH